jgi:sugar/nucleoside kinase (ribokinase family)
VTPPHGFAGRVVTLGETMALLDPVADGELALGDHLVLRIAGAESNFAIGLARLGVEVAWISRLGADRPGALVREALAAEGLDLRWVAGSPMIRPRRPDCSTSGARTGARRSRTTGTDRRRAGCRSPMCRTRRCAAPRWCT